MYTAYAGGGLDIEELEIDDHILDKIESKHGIQLEEAEEVCLWGRPHIRKTRNGLFKVLGRTAAGRYLLVVLVFKVDGVYRLVTAREMTSNERRLYRRVMGV